MGIKNICDKNNLSLDNVCYLITKTITVNALHQQIEVETESMSFCAELSINSNEFFDAGQNSIKASKVLLIDSEGYLNQESVKYENKKYRVYRVYQRFDGMTELYLEERSGVV